MFYQPLYFTIMRHKKIVFNLIKCVKPSFTQINFTSRRYFSQKLKENRTTDVREKKLLPFNDVLLTRRKEADRSILVQVQSAQSHKELYTYCNNIGAVRQMFHYSAGIEPLHFIIIEFEEESDVKKILSKSSHLNNSQIIPVESIFMWFKSSTKKKSKQQFPKEAQLVVENGTAIMSEDAVKETLRTTKNISEQMYKLHNITRLNDVGSRIRFIVAKQIESALSGLFPNIVAYPFGSSVNGYGKMGCDLDIVLRLKDLNKSITDSRLVFHSKANEKLTTQRLLEMVGDLCQFLPGCSHIRKILQARVPIIKYHQQLTDIDCDISMSNMSGVFMSELLYLFGEFDDRVRPLVFTIRKWANDVGLTNNHPGRWITNFSLTLMVLFFLQNSNYSPPVLPSVNDLVKCARSEDNYITEDGINCSFLRDLNNFQFTKRNKDEPESLLQQFFEYYAQFDFQTQAICLNTGKVLVKPDYSPLYIVNPLERGLNVSKNVSPDELEKIKIELRNAMWLMESKEQKSLNWGILSLFDGKRKSYIPHQVKNNKLIEVKKLFEQQEDDSISAIDFKDEVVAKQVKAIKKETKKNIGEIAINMKQGKKSGR